MSLHFINGVGLNIRHDISHDPLVHVYADRRIDMLKSSETTAFYWKKCLKSCAKAVWTITTTHPNTPSRSTRRRARGSYIKSLEKIRYSAFKAGVADLITIYMQYFNISREATAQ